MSKPNPESSHHDVCSSDNLAFPLFLVAVAATATAITTYFLRRRQQSNQPPTLAAPAVCALARAWLSIDPDPQTRAQVSTLLHQFLANPHAPSRLPDALDSSRRLRFGTAGIRAPQGPGYDRINTLVLIGVAQALLRVSSVVSKPLVIGYDARHNSRKYAVVLADVFKQAGAKVLLFFKPVPTPFVAYAVLKKNCALGLCVTASHNPPADNGLKVFHSDGIQIRPGFASRVERVLPECSRPLKTYALTHADLGPVEDPFDEITESYYEQAAKLSLRPIQNSESFVVYTACHGIGYPYILDMFKRFNLPKPIPCEEQCEPDPAFPTLPFPNPEEAGALDLAVQTASQIRGARVVLANDPDADRLGVAEVFESGAYRRFTGDEIALLFVDYMTTAQSNEDMTKFATVASAVSSKVLAALGEKRGFTFREALTGFKWLNKEAVTLEEEGKTVLLTYEEALGYNVTRNLVRDKDGISAAALFAELAGHTYESGKTLSARLEEVYEEIGVHMSHNGYLRTSQKSPSTSSIFESARKEGWPPVLGKAIVKSVRDLTYGTDTAEPDGKARLPRDMSSQFLTFRCEGDDSISSGSSLIIHFRGSGTGM